MSDKNGVTITAFGDVVITEDSIISQLDESDVERLQHNMKHGETITLKTEPPVTICCRSP